MNKTSSQSIKLKLLTPLKKLLETECFEVYFPSSQGQLGIYSGHADLVCKLGTGMMRYLKNDVYYFLVISEGFAEVSKGNSVTLLADIAEDALKIDPTRAEQALQRARQRLSGNHMDEDQIDINRASLAEFKAIARITAFSQLKSGKGNW